MNSFREKLSNWCRNPKKKKLLILACCVVALLLAALCITIIIQSNIQSKYTKAAVQMEEQVYQNLSTMTQLFAHVNDENVDVQNKLIPALKEQYASAASLNEALISGYGSARAVLSEEETQLMEAAFDEYAAAYKEGGATGLAQADMEACIALVQQKVDAHYQPETRPEDEIIIIDLNKTDADNAK